MRVIKKSVIWTKINNVKWLNCILQTTFSDISVKKKNKISWVAIYDSIFPARALVSSDKAEWRFRPWLVLYYTACKWIVGSLKLLHPYILLFAEITSEGECSQNLQLSCFSHVEKLIVIIFYKTHVTNFWLTLQIFKIIWCVKLRKSITSIK